MSLSKKEVKKRYFDKLHAKAPIALCACGCGVEIKTIDKHGRGKKFINGHNSRKYDDPTQYKREWNHRNRVERYNLKNERSRKCKSDLVVIKGGKCSYCGYKYDGKNAAAFDFHHKNPKMKLFNIGVNSFSNYSKKRNQDEAKKCILLCAICHRLHHSSEY